MSKDFYNILGIERSASQDDIKKAFRKLSLKYHPDRTKNDPEKLEKFKKISEAYSILSDPKKRQIYDQTGSTEGIGGSQGFNVDFDSIFNEFGFGDIFGGFKSSSRSSKQIDGNDLIMRTKISLAQAYSGHSTTLEYSCLGSCKSCQGTGADKGLASNISSCNQCNGKGVTINQQGFFAFQSTCSKCQGRGKTIIKTCNVCNGRGRTKINKKITVDIPAGIDNGNRLCLKNQGEAGSQGGNSGDLYVEIMIEQIKNSSFTRKNNDLYCKLPISYYDLYMGGEIKLKFINEKSIMIKVPPKSDTSIPLKIKGLGFNSLNYPGQKGNLFCNLSVTFPSLNSNQKQTLKEMAENKVSNLKENLKNLFNK